MSVRRVGTVAALVAAVGVLSGCSAIIPIAYQVTDSRIDIAFCEPVQASRVEIRFSKYPPPGQGPAYDIAVWSIVGESTSFGDGVPVSESMQGWVVPTIDLPDDWDRVDYVFSDDSGNVTGGKHLFSRDVASSEWTWQTGLYTNKPTCKLQVD